MITPLCPWEPHPYLPFIDVRWAEANGDHRDLLGRFFRQYRLRFRRR